MAFSETLLEDLRKNRLRRSGSKWWTNWLRKGSMPPQDRLRMSGNSGASSATSRGLTRWRLKRRTETFEINSNSRPRFWWFSFLVSAL